MVGIRRRALAAVAVAVAIAAPALPAPAAAAPRGPASPSVMVQLSTLAETSTPAQLHRWLRRVCPAHVVPAGQLVLQDVATDDGSLLTRFLDVVAPYLPRGQAHPCFGRVYVGTVEPVWTGPGNAYADGVRDRAFVDRYLRTSAAVARAFRHRYPHVRADWYVTYEANLNDLYYGQTVAAYRRLLAGELRVLSRVRPGARVMWSPAFWYPYSAYRTNSAGMHGLRTGLTRLFTALHRYGGIDTIDLQDFVAGSACQPRNNRMRPADAVGWVRFLRRLHVARAVEINPEQYAADCPSGGIGPGRPADVRAREAYYRRHHLALGPAFELRYWLHNHRR